MLFRSLSCFLLGSLIFSSSLPAIAQEQSREREILSINCSEEGVKTPEIAPKKPFFINSTDLKRLMKDREVANILFDDTDELMRIEYFTNHVFILSYWRLSEKAPSWRERSPFGISLPVNSQENMTPLFRRLYDKHTVQTVENRHGLTVAAAYRIEACLAQLIERETSL